MKKIFPLVIVMLSLLSLYAGQRPASINNLEKQQFKRDTVILTIPNTISIKNFENKSNQGFDWTKNMPWVGAIFVGITTVLVNLLISHQSRKSSVAVATRQIDNAKTIALEQMELTKKNSERDFNKTVLSATRHVWVNDFRNIISELISMVVMFSFKQKMEPENHHKLNLFVTKAELMLAGEPTHKVLSTLLVELKDYCTDIMMETKSFDDLDGFLLKIKEETSKVLNAEMEKAKKAE